MCQSASSRVLEARNNVIWVTDAKFNVELSAVQTTLHRLGGAVNFCLFAPLLLCFCFNLKQINCREGLHAIDPE